MTNALHVPWVSHNFLGWHEGRRGQANNNARAIRLPAATNAVLQRNMAVHPHSPAQLPCKLLQCGHAMT
jgi:hypothetical protein